MKSEVPWTPRQVSDLVGQVSIATPLDLIDASFLGAVNHRRYPEFFAVRWPSPSELPDTDAFASAEFRFVRRANYLDAGECEALFEGPGSLTKIQIARSQCSIIVGARDASSGQDAVRHFEAAFPAPEPAEEGPPSVPIQLVTGHEDVVTKLDVSPWSEIEANYPASTRAALRDLMDFTPTNRGRLLILHGPPGTGKTFALGALAWAWRSWALPAFVADPERLLDQPERLYRLMTDSYASRQSRWCLVILEDAGELFASDARERSGQDLSRLLNATDGFLAHGTKVLFAITTNEPVDTFHEAVSRPGRCAGVVEFERFPSQEARAWLGSDPPGPAGELSLAELFAIQRGEIPPIPSRNPVGFISGVVRGPIS